MVQFLFTKSYWPKNFDNMPPADSLNYSTIQKRGLKNKLSVLPRRSQRGTNEREPKEVPL